MKAELAKALAEFQADLPEIVKTETAEVKDNQGRHLYSYNYADLARVSKIVLPRLAKFGLSFSAKPTLNPEGKFVLAYVLRHTSGEEDEGTYPLTGSTPQMLGGAITYARRYALCAVTGVAPEADDDDAAAASQREQREPPRGQQRTAQRRQRATVNGTPANGEKREHAAAGPPPLPGEDGQPARMTGGPGLTDLHATFGRLGVKDRDDGLAVIAEVVKRPVASSKELTSEEVATLVAKLRDVEVHDDRKLMVAEMVERGRVVRARQSDGGSS